MLFADHIKVLDGPRVARGPDAAQACFICNFRIKDKILYLQRKKRLKMVKIMAPRYPHCRIFLGRKL